MTNATVWMAFLIAGTVAAAPDGDVPPPAKAVSLSVGDVLPDFGSTADTGEAWKTSDHVGKKYLVLYCYPGDFTGGCTAQAQKYRDTLAKIEQLGAEVVGISGDEVATHKLFKETYGLKHALLSDPKGAVAELLGVPVKAGGKLKATGPDRKPLLDDNGNRIEITRAATLARWTLVVDRAGKIISLKSTVNPVSDAEDVEKLLAAANAGLPAAAAVGAATKESLLQPFRASFPGITPSSRSQASESGCAWTPRRSSNVIPAARRTDSRLSGRPRWPRSKESSFKTRARAGKRLSRGREIAICN